MAGAQQRGTTSTAHLESVWDYPVPPVVEPSEAHAQVILNGFVVADSRRTRRVLQTGIPPVHYFPPEDVQTVYLRPAEVDETCTGKGQACRFDVIVGDRVAEAAAWSFPDPEDVFSNIAGFIAFYPGRMDACLLNGEPCRIDPDDESGGWVTPNIQGLSRGYPRTWDRGELD
jgi:uncharacterized protein (DUF427 family)